MNTGVVFLVSLLRDLFWIGIKAKLLRSVISQVMTWNIGGSLHVKSNAFLCARIQF